MGGSLVAQRDPSGSNAHGKFIISKRIFRLLTLILSSITADRSVSAGERIKIIFSEMKALDNQRRYFDRESERLNDELVEILNKLPGSP